MPIFMKERVTLTLDSEILKQIDQSIDGFHIKNRSHAIELLLHQGLQSDIPGHAIIMAAGKKMNGMKKVHNKPIIEHLINLFKKYHIKNILIGVCFEKEKIMDYFGSGSRYGVKIRYIDEEKPSGTVNLVKKARSFLSGAFFVTNADELKDINLSDMYHTHKENNAVASIALTTVEDPASYGVVKVDGLRVRGFEEKPSDESQTKLINAGLYLFDIEVLDLIPEKIKMFYDYFPILAEQNKLIAYHFSGKWYDVSNKESYEKAEKEWDL
jgi:NDP-sugar pyrophosphorylase family protein